MGQKETHVGDLCKELGVTRQNSLPPRLAVWGTATRRCEADRKDEASSVCGE